MRRAAGGCVVKELCFVGTPAVGGGVVCLWYQRTWISNDSCRPPPDRLGRRSVCVAVGAMRGFDWCLAGHCLPGRRDVADNSM